LKRFRGRYFARENIPFNSLPDRLTFNSDFRLFLKELAMSLFDDIEKVLISEAQLQKRIAELGAEMNALYTDEDYPMLKTLIFKIAMLPSYIILVNF